MKTFLGLTFAAVLAVMGAGCASHSHSEHRRPEPVVMPGPVVVHHEPHPVSPHRPPIVVLPAIDRNQAVQIAHAEAARHGWRSVSISKTGYWNDRWHVDLYTGPNRHKRQYGWVEIAPNGQVVAFSDTPRRQPGYDRDRRRR